MNLPGFELYSFKNAKINKVREVIEHFKNYFQNSQYDLVQIERNKQFSVDFVEITENQQLITNYPTFIDDLTSNTEFTIACLGLGMFQTIRQTTPIIEHAIKCRIINHQPVLMLKDVNAASCDKLVSLRGTVIKCSPMEVVCTNLAFKCPSCDSTQVVPQINGAFTQTTKCSNCKFTGNFEVDHRSPLTETVEQQTVTIQENNCDGAKIPETIDCELVGDLVKTCLPGDEVTLTGIIKVVDPNDSKNKQNTLFTLYMRVISVYNNKSESSSMNSTEKIIFTPEDYAAIKEIHSQPNLFSYLVQSLCPTIYGHDVIKAGLLLGLFRGSQSTTNRAESHVLVVGDPGLGKSQLLRSCTHVSPRGVYVCGNVTTTSGLTVTMSRETGGEYSLEAGALMIADQGCCAIDEFDKMTSQHGLLEVMEQQTISIAKAGTVCSLPTKPTVLAAANPVRGHYDKSKTVTENLKIGAAMLSRFDLIFILLDQPDEHVDQYVSSNILASSSKRPKTDHQIPSATLKGLAKRLKTHIGDLNHKTFRKYIAYAQKYVQPTLTDPAKALLKSYYLSLRQRYATGDCTPVTMRQLHSLIRLTEARAKAELREQATQSDAQDVIDIMNHSLVELFTDRGGSLDLDRSQLGTGMSFKNKVMKILELLQQRSDQQGRSLFNVQEIRELSEEVNLPKNKFQTVLQSLNIQGYLLSKGKALYQLNSAYL